MNAQRKANLIAMAPLLVATLVGSAEAKPVKGEFCPTKVSGRITECRPEKKCELKMKEGDVLSNIQYFGSKGCRKKTGFTRVKVDSVDQKGVVLHVKGVPIPGLKERFRIEFKARKLSRRVRELGIRAGRTKSPKVARLILRN